MFCSNCGKEIEDGTKFCKYCGKTIAIETTQNKKNGKRNSKNADSHNGLKTLRKFLPIFMVVIIAILAVELVILFGSSKGEIEEKTADSGNDSQITALSEETNSLDSVNDAEVVLEEKGETANAIPATNESVQEKEEEKEEEKEYATVEVFSYPGMGAKDNVALFIVDGSPYRKCRNKGNFILSIDDATGVMRVVNIYKDALFWNKTNENGQNEYDKIETTYPIDGACQAIASLNFTLDMDIMNFIVLGEPELVEIVDYLGGIQYEITDSELLLINDNSEVQLQEAGNVTLNGEQVTALILPVIKTYYGTEMDALDRRFCVMRAISQKLYDMDEDSYNDAKQYICERIYTSLDEDESIGLLRCCASLSLTYN